MYLIFSTARFSRGGWRAGCTAAAEAANVTAGTVLWSAWLGRVILRNSVASQDVGKAICKSAPHDHKCSVPVLARPRA